MKIKVVDTESDPTKAAEVSSKLILKDEVDLMVVLHTPDVVNPVSAMCERYRTPCISLDRLLKRGSPADRTNGVITLSGP